MHNSSEGDGCVPGTSRSNELTVDQICENLETLKQKYNFNAKNVKTIIRKLYDSEVFSKVTGFDTSEVPSLKITRSKMRNKIRQEQCQDTPCSSTNNLLASDFDEEDDEDYAPSNDEDDSDDAYVEDDEDLARDVQWLHREWAEERPKFVACNMNLDLEGLMASPIKARSDVAYELRSRAINLNLSVGHDALEKERGELDKAKCPDRLGPDYAAFLLAPNVPPDDDDDEADPEFVPDIVELETLDKEPEERVRRRVLIPPNEHRDLFSDLTQAERQLCEADAWIPPIDLTKSRKRRPKSTKKDPLPCVPVESCEVDEAELKLSAQQRRQLKQQFEIFTQLLVQSIIACEFNDDLSEYKADFYGMMNDLEANYKSAGPGSVYDVSNMSAAISCCHSVKFYNKVTNFHALSPKSSIGTPPHLNVPLYLPRPEVIHILRHSLAILYPELLPEVELHKNVPTKCFFTDSDDLLILLAFKRYGNVTRRNSDHQIGITEIIQQNYVPGKKLTQLYHRIRRLRETQDSTLKLLCSNDPQRYECVKVPPLKLRRLLKPTKMEQWPQALKPSWLERFDASWKFCPDTRQFLRVRTQYDNFIKRPDFLCQNMIIPATPATQFIIVPSELFGFQNEAVVQTQQIQPVVIPSTEPLSCENPAKRPRLETEQAVSTSSSRDNQIFTENSNVTENQDQFLSQSDAVINKGQQEIPPSEQADQAEVSSTNMVQPSPMKWSDKQSNLVEAPACFSPEQSQSSYLATPGASLLDHPAFQQSSASHISPKKTCFPPNETLAEDRRQLQQSTSDASLSENHMDIAETSHDNVNPSVAQDAIQSLNQHNTRSQNLIFERLISQCVSQKVRESLLTNLTLRKSIESILLQSTKVLDLSTTYLSLERLLQEEHPHLLTLLSLILPPSSLPLRVVSSRRWLFYKATIDSALLLCALKKHSEAACRRTIHRAFDYCATASSEDMERAPSFDKKSQAHNFVCQQQQQKMQQILQWADKIVSDGANVFFEDLSCEISATNERIIGNRLAFANDSSCSNLPDEHNDEYCFSADEDAVIIALLQAAGSADTDDTYSRAAEILRLPIAVVQKRIDLVLQKMRE